MIAIDTRVDPVTQQLQATALPDFHAWLHPFQRNHYWYVAHVTVKGKVHELLRKRVGTLDEWREWIEDALAQAAEVE
jgi:hypothetical protein